VNFDCSPTLRLQSLPLVGRFFRDITKANFDKHVQYGDVRRSLPLRSNSVQRLYCSHVLEHLALEDFHHALAESFRVLQPHTGIFRGVLPDMERLARDYLADNSTEACTTFMRETYLGRESRPRGLKGALTTLLGNSQHLWMWDYRSLDAALRAVGFVDIRRAYYGDSAYEVYSDVESEERWVGQLGFECRKPPA
jgi:hypothetical protein